MDKKQLEQTLHRRFLWHEYTDKGTYLVGGRFEESDPIEVISKREPNHKMHSYIKCAGVVESTPVEAFSAGKMCAKCHERASAAMYACSMSSGTFYNYDITSDTSLDDDDIHVGRVVVPMGCPHATQTASVSDEEKREYKYEAATVEGGPYAKRTIPFSWKIVESGDKLTLSIQYRQRYIDTKRIQVISNSLYCHISCNLKTGHTYISDVHAGNRHLYKGLMSTGMETMTFIDRSSMLSTIPQSNVLREPLWKLYDLLIAKLQERGYECCSSDDISLGGQWKASIPNLTKYKDEQELLRDIAIMNRFPNLGCRPLPANMRNVVSLYLRRRFDHLAREVSRDTLIKALKLEEMPRLHALVEKKPDMVVFAVMLSEWGFSVEDIEKYAMKEFSDVLSMLEKILSVQNKHGRNYEIFDMLSLVMPIALIHGIDKSRNPISKSMDKILTTGSIIEKMNEFVSQLKTFRKFGIDWKSSPDKVLFNWEPHQSSLASISLIANGKETVKLTMSLMLYLDRRAWHKKQAQAYVEWLKELKTDELDKIVQEKKQAMEKALIRSIRFAPELMSARRQEFLPVEKEARVVYEWAYKNDVEVDWRIDSYYHPMGKKCRRNIEKRIENKRKAKRNKKTAGSES